MAKQGSKTKMNIGDFVYDSQNDSTVLTIITLTLSSFGILLSTAALIVLYLTAYFFQEWRQVYKNQLLIQFMTARFINTSIRYVHDMLHVFKCEVNWNWSPIIVYIFSIIYSDMVLVSWMYVFSKHMYDSFVKVCNAKKFTLWKVSMCAWVIPAGILIFLYGLYSIPSQQDLFFILIYQVFIKWPVLCVNGIQLGLILKYILSSNQSKTENNFRIVLVMILLIFTFSTQQAIGDVLMFLYVVTYKTYDRVPVLTTLFNIASVYQCGFTIMFWLFGNTNTRKLWTFKNENESLRRPINQQYVP